MDNNTFMGLLITAIVVLVGLAGAITSLIVIPVIKLNKNITKLDCNIDLLLKENSETKKHFEKNDNEIDLLRNRVIEQEGELKVHDTRIKALEKRG